MGFESNVFVNCPFDDEYIPLLRPILFVILDLGLTPRIALEALDSGKPRVEKIITLIEKSKYGIHDLSRLRAGFHIHPRLRRLDNLGAAPMPISGLPAR